MNTKLNAKQMSLREACVKECRGCFEKERSRSGFAEGMKKFRLEYAMNVAMHQAESRCFRTGFAVLDEEVFG